MADHETNSPGTPEFEEEVRREEPQGAANETSAFDAAFDQADLSAGDDLGDAATDIETLTRELEEMRNRALRAHAELDNYQKRAKRQMEDERRYASIDLIRDLLPVWDNMGRALEAAEQSDDSSSLLEGLKMMASQLVSALERHHCKEIEALHQPFDPHLHEALAQMPTDEHPPGTVVAVHQPGFLLHDRVVRPSQVFVATAPPAPAESESSEE